MRDDEFKRRYGELQDGVRTPPALAERTLAAVWREEARARVRKRGQTAAPRSRAPQPHLRDRGRLRQRAPLSGVGAASASRRWGMAAALAAAAGAATLALALALAGFGGGASTAVPEGLLAVKAYAASAASSVEADEEGRIVFPQDLRTALQGAAADPGDEGVYTGALFTVEAAGAERVQATLSGGELCSYAFDEFTAGEHPDKLAELMAWKPTKRGTGEHYGAYDYVSMSWADDGLDRDDPGKTVQARLVKRLGRTVDLPVAEGESPCLGLWFSCDGEDGGARGGAADPWNFVGEELTVTVQFADGRCQTQVIGLRAGTFAAEKIGYAAGSAGDALPVGDPVVPDDTADADRIYALFGVVESSADEPHPYPLDSANEHAGSPVDALAPSDALEPIGAVETSGLPEADAVNRTGERDAAEMWFIGDAGETYALGRVRIDNVTARVEERLPEGLDLATGTAVAGFFGDIDYYNACRRITHGYEVDADGTLSEGFSYLVVGMDVAAAASGENRYVSVQELGVPAAIDAEEGVVRTSTLTAFACRGATAADKGGWDRIALPGTEARRVEAVFIVSDDLLESGELALQIRRLDEGADDLTATKPGYIVIPRAADGA